MKQNGLQQCNPTYYGDVEMSKDIELEVTMILSNGSKQKATISGAQPDDAQWIAENGYKLTIEMLPHDQIVLYLEKGDQSFVEGSSYAEKSIDAITRLVNKAKRPTIDNPLVSMINNMDSDSKQFAIFFKSVPNMRGGTKNPFRGRVEKVTNNAVVEVYADCSTWAEQLAKEAEAKGEPPYEPKPRRWGTRIGNSPFIKHTKDGEERLYLEMFMVSPGDTHYEIDGVQATDEQMNDLAPYLPKSQSNDLGILVMNVDNIKGMVEV